MVQRSIKIQREISRIENIYPDDNIIITYKDFLKHRDSLHLYQYNRDVFCSLIDITYSLWDSDKRISRKSLLQVTKRYFMKSITRDGIPHKTATQIFELFRQIVVYENLKLRRETVEDLKKTINSMLIGIKLNETQLKWLCEHANHSPFILNRILRYNYKSNVITNLAKHNFEKDIARDRRSEITSWIIDKNPAFAIDKETFKFDFEFQNAFDKKRWNDYTDDYSAYRAVESELSPIFMTDENNIEDEKGVVIGVSLLPEPEYKQIRRVYMVSTGTYDMFSIEPDFEITAESFYSDFDNYYNRSMAWSIAYSRISIADKIKYICRYYDDSIYPTFFNIGVRLKNVEYFKWLELISDE